jgi:hypothetical protein
MTFSRHHDDQVLIDARTNTEIGTATPEHVAASDESERQGQHGIFLINADQQVVTPGSWDATQTTCRVVYTINADQQGVTPAPTSWSAKERSQ